MVDGTPPNTDPKQDHEPERITYGIPLTGITPEFVRDVVRLYVEIACTYPEFYTDPTWLGGIGYDPEKAAQQVVEELTNNSGGTSLICSYFDLSDEGVFFRMTWNEEDYSSSNIVSVQYDSGDFRHSRIQEEREMVEMKAKKFDEAVQVYLNERGIGVPLPK